MKITQFVRVAVLALCVTDTYSQGFFGELATSRMFFGPKDGNSGHRPRQMIYGAVTVDVGKRRTAVKTRRDCPEGFVPFRNSCFSQSLTPETWTSARLACQGASRDGDLASINSKEELNFIQTKFGNGTDELSWIGLHKDRPGTPYTWANGDKVQYLPWVSNYTGQEPTGHVALSLTNLHFIPKPSPNELLPYLCGTRKISVTARPAAAGRANLPAAVGDIEKKLKEGKMGTKAGRLEILYTCREGWESFKGKCYKTFDEKGTYEDANAFCKTKGAYLISLHSPLENEFVRQQIMRRPGELYWLGLKTNKNGMLWSDSSPFDFSNFASYIHITIPEEEDDKVDLGGCFQIDSDDLKWDSEDCNEVLKFMCSRNGVLQRAPITHPVKIAMPAPDSALTTARRTLHIIDMGEAAKKAEPKPVGTKEPFVESLVRAPITHRVRIATPAPASALTTARRTLQIIDMREAAKKAEPKPVGTKDPLVEFWGELMKVVGQADNLEPSANVSKIVTDLLNSDVFKENQKSASADSVSDGTSNQQPVNVLVVLVGFVVVVVAAFGAILWRRRYGNFPLVWAPPQDPSTSKHHNLQGDRQSLRDPEAGSVNQQGIYGAME